MFPKENGVVSVLMPAYQTPGLVGGAIESILQQSDLPHGWTIEVCVGIDGCQDTFRAAQKFVDEPRVRLFHMKGNRGPYVTLNTLLDASTGDAIAILDSDDRSLPGRLGHQLQALIAGDEIVGSLYQVKDSETGQVVDGPTCSERPSIAKMAYGLHSTWCARRYVYEELGGYAGWRCGADTEFWIRAIAQGFKARVLQRRLVERLVRPGQLTSVGAATGPGSQTRQKARADVNSLLAGLKRGAGVPKTRGVRHTILRQQGSPRITALIPSIPSRSRTAKKVVEGFLAQGVDRVVLYLNGYRSVPAWAKRKSIDARLRPPGTGPIVRYLEHHDSGIVLTADDDLIYPANYVSATVRHLFRLGRGNVISYHCSHWPQGKSALEDRVILSFGDSSSSYKPKTYMGSGVAGFFGSDFNRIVRSSVPRIFHRLDDVWISAAVSRAGLNIYRPPSTKRWIQAYPEQDQGIYSQEIAEKFASRKKAIAAALRLGNWPLTPQHRDLP